MSLYRVFDEFFNDPFFNPRHNLALIHKDTQELVPQNWKTESPVLVDENPENYVVTVSGAKDRQFTVDYLKNENQLSIKSTKEVHEKNDEGERTFKSSTRNSVVFEKPVKPEDIKGDVQYGNLVITVPKVEVDTNIVRIPISHL